MDFERKKDRDEESTTSFASARDTLPSSSKESKGKERRREKESSSSSDGSSSSSSGSGSSDDHAKRKRRRRKKKKRNKRRKGWLEEGLTVTDRSGQDEAIESLEDTMEDVLEPLSNTPYAGPSYLAISLVLKVLSFLPGWITMPIAKVMEFVAGIQTLVDSALYHSFLSLSLCGSR